MKPLVLYSTQYGSTRQYAEWIAEDINADIFPAENLPDLLEYDTVIFGAPVFGGAIKDIAVIENNMDILKNTRLFIFTVGITPPTAEKNMADLLAKNYTTQMMNHAQTYHFLGAIEYKKLKIGHKLLLKSINSSMRNKLDLNQNHVSRDSIKPLVDAVLGDANE